MGFTKAALNFMVKNSKGELVRSVLCHTKPPKMPINIKGLKFAPALQKDTVQISKKEIELINKQADELLKELKEDCHIAYIEKHNPDVVKNVENGIIGTGTEIEYWNYKCLERLYKKNPEVFVFLGKEKGDVTELILACYNYGKSTIEMIKNTPIQEMRKVVAETETFYKKSINSNNINFPDYVHMLIMRKKNPAVYEYLNRTSDKKVINKVKSWGDDFRAVPSSYMLETITPEQINVMTHDALPRIRHIREYVTSSDAFILNDKAVKELSAELSKCKLSTDVKLYRGEKTVGMFNSVAIDKDFEKQLRQLLETNKSKARNMQVSKYSGKYNSLESISLYDFLSSKENLTLADAMQLAKFGDEKLVNEIIKRIKASKIIDNRFKSLSFDEGMAGGWMARNARDNTTIIQNATVKKGTQGGYHNDQNGQYEVILNNTPKEVKFSNVIYHKDGDYFELNSEIQNII